MDKPNKDEFKGFDKAGDEETIISAFIKWDNCPKDPEEIKQIIERIQNDMVRSFAKELIQFYGISPIKQGLDEVKKMTLVTSCICCRHWKIDMERTYLLGICELSSKDISYDRVCEFWDKIV
jgi:hypothetical protein